MNERWVSQRMDPGEDSPAAIARDIAAVGRISAVPSLLRILCYQTGMGFAAVARVTNGTWTACAVQDDIQFGLQPGGQLEVRTTLCSEVRASREPIVIDHASLDPTYRDHHTPRLYGIESYVSVPIVFSDGRYFGNLCAIDPRPAQVSDERTVAMFTAYAELIALQLESEALREQASADLRDERARAQMREEFIAVLGHDLRSPLSALANMAAVLVRQPDQPVPPQLARRMLAATGRMAALIDDVLDFTRARLGGGIGIAPVWVEALAPALRDVVAEKRLSDPDRLLREDLRIEQPVWCDRGRVQQILANLLGNAMRHGAPDQPVEITARIEPGDAAGAMLVLAVANQGVPIDPANLPRVFEPYWRSPDSHQQGGLGLGLHICAQIARAHGGHMTVESSAERGTRFAAHLPVAPHGAA